MTKLTAMVILANDDGSGGEIHSADVIEFDGRLWLVPEWLDYQDDKVTMPARIVLLDVIPHDRAPGSSQIVISGPVPKSVFDGRVPQGQESQYVVIERPNIQLPLPGATH